MVSEMRSRDFKQGGQEGFSKSKHQKVKKEQGSRPKAGARRFREERVIMCHTCLNGEVDNLSSAGKHTVITGASL